MKTKFKIIIPASVAVILIALMVIFNVPYNLNKSLLFNNSDRIIISVAILNYATTKVAGFWRKLLMLDYQA